MEKSLVFSNIRAYNKNISHSEQLQYGEREPVYLPLPKGGAGGVHRLLPAYVFHQISSAESRPVYSQNKKEVPLWSYWSNASSGLNRMKRRR